METPRASHACAEHLISPSKLGDHLWSRWFYLVSTEAALRLPPRAVPAASEPYVVVSGGQPLSPVPASLQERLRGHLSHFCFEECPSFQASDGGVDTVAQTVSLTA